ncbi:MFS transporter [Desemzia sp. RIT804]|uniref:MFS transporter n=1 Tax=Desemzia sp. RIT 804 TaxID=2810209 RepID=UPI001950B619|nr:MFS transporter [Desemzia sp. RIT 804]MBM6613771.1 MFS transporter [Desemzia sp. RIT 804]
MNTHRQQHPSNWVRNITLFLSSQTITLFGSSLVQYAMLWHVTLTTDSGTMMTLYIICGFIPTFLLSPVAGVWADRYNRKVLIMLSDGLIAFATLILAILFFLGFDSIWFLYLMAAIRAFGTGIQTPAIGAILPQIVPEEMLTKINGINGTIQAMIMFISPVVSAALLDIATMEMIFMIDVVTATLAIAALLILKVPTHYKATEEEMNSYFTDFMQGIKYIQHHDYLKVFFFFMSILFLLIAPASFLTPLQVTRTYGEELWRLSAIEIAFSIGMMAGGALIAIWGGFKNKIITIAAASIVMGLCTIALGVLPNFWYYLVSFGVFGVALPVFNTPATVMLQEKVSENYLGRVFGIMSMISTSMMPLGMLVFGPLADILKIEWILVGTGILISILAIFLTQNKTLIKAGE